MIEMAVEENKFNEMPRSVFKAFYYHLIGKDFETLPYKEKIDLDEFKIESINVDFSMFTV